MYVYMYIFYYVLTSFALAILPPSFHPAHTHHLSRTTPPSPPSLSLPLPLLSLSQVPTSGSDIKGYEILYWPIASSVYETESVSSVEATETTIHDLSPYTQYLVAVRLYCGEDLFGLASVSVTFITEASGKPWGSIVTLYINMHCIYSALIPSFPISTCTCIYTIYMYVYTCTCWEGLG